MKNIFNLDNLTRILQLCNIQNQPLFHHELQECKHHVHQHVLTALLPSAVNNKASEYSTVSVMLLTIISLSNHQ